MSRATRFVSARGDELSLSLFDAFLAAGRVDTAEQHVQGSLRLSKFHDWPAPPAASRQELERARWTRRAGI
ncbi:hypothetical protein [Streptomyces sp. NPDC014623]|uniref:hypothetical protein n=1 Tax=Streptomyces sp. NPDC014623 TaxID=3364875 RepID=UPI0036FC5B69